MTHTDHLGIQKLNVGAAPWWTVGSHSQPPEAPPLAGQPPAAPPPGLPTLYLHHWLANLPWFLPNLIAS